MVLFYYQDQNTLSKCFIFKFALSVRDKETIIIGKLAFIGFRRTRRRILCQNAFLFKLAFSLGNKETFGNISLTIEVTNSILPLVLK